MLAARVFAGRTVSTARQLLKVSNRCVSSSAVLFDARPFLMPAMSPTMEKGGIVSWRVKEGDAFSAGDVLLEVETDKAQIDVEAQDDGKLAKIVYTDGSKDVSVGEVIAFTADPEDDVSKLEIPEIKKETSAKSQGAKSQGAKSQETSRQETSRQETSRPAAKTGSKLSKADPQQTLLPSVAMALADNGLGEREALEKIRASGPHGRLLKGDVLAYAGKISEDSVVRVADFVKRGERLDLSNIETVTLRPTEQGKPGEPAQPAVAPARPPPPPPVHEEVVFETDASAGMFSVERSVRAYIDEAYAYAHETSGPASDRYDPVFEYLVTAEPRFPRFGVEYTLTQLGPDPETATTSQGHNTYSLAVTVTPNGKFTDSLSKSELFLACLRELEQM